MPDFTKTNIENQNSERKSKRSFFGGSLNERSKDFLDFRYNTQEEIDKLNEEMSTNEELNDAINNDEKEYDNERNDEIFYEENKIEETKEAEDNLEKNLNNIDETIDTSVINYIWEENNEDNIKDNDENENTENKNDQIIDLDKTGAEEEIKEDNDENNEVIEGDIQEEKSEEAGKDNKENDNLSTDLFEDNSNKEDAQENSKFFDPFELDLENYSEEENIENENNMFDPFGLNDENEEPQDEEYSEVQNEDEEIQDEDEEVQDENEEVQDEKTQDEEYSEVQNEDEEVQDENEEVQDEKTQDEEYGEVQNEDEGTKIQDEDNNGIREEDDEDEDKDDIEINTPIPVNPNQKDENEELIKNRKIKKNSATGEVVTDEEIELEQGQDIPDTEQDEEYQPSDEEIFEQEPEFFADDEISQQFLHLVQNVRGTFKLENKNGENDPYFKIIGGKTEEYTTEYLFYLIEEENEPVDLYIKKVETNQSSEEENEHLVQFSYNEDKELNIFVDEIILYERVNKSDSDSVEYNDTKTILEKFIFLTENHYNKLKSELDKQREEKKKKRQLQQIFKGF